MENAEIPTHCNVYTSLGLLLIKNRTEKLCFHNNNKERKQTRNINLKKLNERSEVRLPCCSGGSYVSIAGCLNKKHQRINYRITCSFFVCVCVYNDFLVL